MCQVNTATFYKTGYLYAPNTTDNIALLKGINRKKGKAAVKHSVLDHNVKHFCVNI